MSDNLKTIENLIKERLPFLGDTQEEAITSQKIQAMYFMQKYLLKSDDDVEDESKYKPLERMLVAYYASWRGLTIKAITIAGGDSTGSGAENSFLKKAKADVVEAEFEQVDINKGVTLARKVDALIAELKSEICSIAQNLEIGLPMCECEFGYNKPFIIVNPC